MSLAECYECAILSALRDETLDVAKKAQVLEVLVNQKRQEEYLSRPLGEQLEETC